MANFLITTTPLLDNIKIHHYIGPVIANLVLGVNFFSDFAASFTDVFGGNSNTYQSKLDRLTKDVNKIIQDKAFALGANAIIDYKLQFNEISGKGKQMFMVTATGTACIITMPKQEEIEKVGQVAFDEINRQYFISLYKKKIENKENLSTEEWENIYILNMTELASELTEEFFSRHVNCSEFDTPSISFRQKYMEYLNRLDKDLAAACIYPYIDSFPDVVAALVTKHNLFDPKIVLEQLDKGNIATAIELLNSNKDYYSISDLAKMRQIISRLNDLPDKGSIEVRTVKSGMFSKKDEEVYICPEGHINPNYAKFCGTCLMNMKGLRPEQSIAISKFTQLSSILENLLK